ncbi:MAG: glutathione synthase [Pseudomonadota bacterium]
MPNTDTPAPASSRRMLFVMDPLASLALKKDSTLAMIRAAAARGWDVHTCEQQDLGLHEGEVCVHARSITLRADFAEALDIGVLNGDHRLDNWCQPGDTVHQPLTRFGVIMMRKDPPFDMEYIYSTYLLERAEEAGCQVINRPQSLRDCNEKFFATAFADVCPPLIVARRMDDLMAFQRQYRNVVFKQLDGMGGKSVFRVLDGDANLKVILETLTQGEQQQIMGQLYLPEIADGDKRILMIDGEPVPYALARIPAVGEARGNLAAGGTGEGRPLTDRDRHIAERVGPALKARGLRFVGIDVIGDYLTEVNVTCPTCIRELDAQFSLDIAGTLMDRLETV